MSCPRCSSVIVTKDGTTELGGQRFRCSPCGRRFTRRSSSAFSGRGSPTTPSPWRCAGTCATGSFTPKSVNGSRSAASSSIRAPSTAGSNASCRFSRTRLAGIVSRSVPIGVWTRPTPAFADAGTTSIVRSTETVRSSMPTYRRRETWPRHVCSSSGPSRPVERRHVGSSPTRPPPIHRLSPLPFPVSYTGVDAIARMGSSAITGF